MRKRLRKEISILLTLAMTFTPTAVTGASTTDSKQSLTVVSESVSEADELCEEVSQAPVEPILASEENADAKVYTSSGRKSISKLSMKQLSDMYGSIKSYTSIYAVAPDVEGTDCHVSTLSKDAYQNAADWINYFRTAAGLETITLTDVLNKSAAYGSLTLAMLNDLTHDPAKPADMSAMDYAQGYYAASKSNLAYAYGYLPSQVIRSAITGGMGDVDTYNIPMMGHRRWILNPSTTTMGVGVANNNYSYYTAIRVMGENVEHNAVADYDFIAWPSSGNNLSDLFPIDTPWTITLCPDRFQQPKLDETYITLENDQGELWEFNAGMDPTEGYFNVDTMGFGVNNCIIFRPAPETLYGYTGQYTVTVSGIKTTSGAASTLVYDVVFASNKSITATATATSTATATATAAATGIAGPTGTAKPTATATAAAPKLSGKNVSAVIGDKTFTIALYDTKAASEFYSMLPMDLDMDELNGNEKYCYVDDPFTTDDRRSSIINAGDFKIYDGDCIVLFYESFNTPYKYTDVGRIESVMELKEALGAGSVNISFSQAPDTTVSDNSVSGNTVSGNTVSGNTTSGNSVSGNAAATATATTTATATATGKPGSSHGATATATGHPVVWTTPTPTPTPGPTKAPESQDSDDDYDWIEITMPDGTVINGYPVELSAKKANVKGMLYIDSDGCSVSQNRPFVMASKNKKLKLSKLTKKGYKFTGWKTVVKGKLKKVSALNSKTFTDGMTVSANFAELSYSLSYSVKEKGIKVYGKPVAVKQYYTGKVVLVNNLKADGYVLEGFTRTKGSKEAEFAPGAVVPVSALAPDKGNRIKLYAVWRKK